MSAELNRLASAVHAIQGRGQPAGAAGGAQPLPLPGQPEAGPLCGGTVPSSLAASAHGSPGEGHGTAWPRRSMGHGAAWQPGHTDLSAAAVRATTAPAGPLGRTTAARAAAAAAAEAAAMVAEAVAALRGGRASAAGPSGGVCREGWPAAGPASPPGGPHRPAPSSSPAQPQARRGWGPRRVNMAALDAEASGAASFSEGPVEEGEELDAEAEEEAEEDGSVLI